MLGHERLAPAHKFGAELGGVESVGPGARQHLATEVAYSGRGVLLEQVAPEDLLKRRFSAAR